MAPASPRPVRGDAELRAAFDLRLTVFSEEQGVPREAEIDDHEDEATHLVAMDGRAAAATCRLRYLDGGATCKLERMAVAAGQRGTGLGSALLTAAEGEARRHGASEMMAHAQTRARGFYEQGGYSVVDPEPFMEDGIEHVKMSRPL